MNVLILDPGLFDIPGDMPKECQIEHYNVLKESVEYASKYIDAVLDSYRGAPYLPFYDEIENNYFNPPITRSYYIRANYAAIKKRIQKMMKQGRNVDVSESEPASSKLMFESDTTTEVPFRKYLSTVLFSGINHNATYLMLLSIKNSNLSPHLDIISGLDQVSVDSVYKPSVDCTCVVGKYLRNDLCGNEIFPNLQACENLNDAFWSQKKDGPKTQAEKRALYILYGKEAATRNHYFYDSVISHKKTRITMFL